MLNKFKASAVAIAMMAVPVIAMAGNLGDVCAVANLIEQFVNVFAFIVFVLAVASILYAGFLFLTSGGSEEKVKSGRQALVWGLIGIAVALFSVYAITFVISIVGGDKTASCNFGTGLKGL